MLISLIIILIMTLTLPFAIKKVEHNLEFFLFLMGLLSVIVTGLISIDLFKEILENSFLYMITVAVFVAGIAFKLFKDKFKVLISKILEKISINLFVFLIIVILGLISSVITAIVASLILVEIIVLLPLDRLKKIEITITSCFSIGLGATLTPIGEPIATIVVSKLDVSFFYIFQQLAIYIVPGIVILGLIGVWFVEDKSIKNIFSSKNDSFIDKELNEYFGADNFEIDEDTIGGICHRTFKIFVFVIALELLGSGFKPIIDDYVIKIDSHFLFWGNMISAVLDNATLAAAEISPKMSGTQINAVLMGLLISGGMLVPGNIPNIVSASKLKIKSSEWARIGVPLGLVMLSGYFLVLYVI